MNKENFQRPLSSRLSTNNDDDSFQNDSFIQTKQVNSVLAPSIETAIIRQHESLFSYPSHHEEIMPDGSIRGQAASQQQM